MKKRVISITIIVAMTLAAFFSGTPQMIKSITEQGVDADALQSLNVYAGSWPKLRTIDYEATGNQKKDIVGFAKTQVGYEEKGNNNTYFGHWYGLNFNPWCAMFVSWCGFKAGCDTSVVPRLANCDRTWAKKQGVYHKSKYWGGSYKPRKGDLIYFSWSVRDSADHIGIVTGTGTEDGNKYVYTIEGNKHDQVIKQTYLLNNRYILGYASPKYVTSSETYRLKYRDGLAETSADEDESIIEPVKGTFCKALELSDTEYKYKGHKYTQWQFYRNIDGERNYLYVDKESETIEGWYTKDTKPKKYKKAKIDLGGTLTLYTEFEGKIFAEPAWEVKTYKVKYDANGGEDEPEDQYKIYDETLTLTEDQPTRIGYSCKGWSKDEEADSVDYKSGAEYTKNKKLSLYAVWKGKENFRVKVIKDGKLKVRSGPDTSYEVIDKVEKGTKLNIVSVEDDWGKIEETEGWIPLKHVKELK